MNPQAGFAANVSELGQGPRRVLALHCTLAFGGAWGGVAKRLGDRLTLVAPDMPSHGHSADWDEVSDFGETVYTASLAQMTDAPMDLIGHSFGAAIALRIAAAYPNRVRSLTLFEPVFFAVALADDPDSLAHHDDRAHPFHDAIKRGEMMEAARAFNGMWSDGADWDRLPERSRAAMARAIHVVPGTVPFLYDDVCGMLAPGVLDVVKAPTVMMRGEHALPAIKATNAGLTTRLGNASEVVIAEAGHMAPISHAADVATVISDLLDRS